MARIGKAEHSKILHGIDVEGRKVTEVAAEQGCTPAAIYALLSKLRRAAAQEKRAAEPLVAEAAAEDLFAAAPEAPAAPVLTRPQPVSIAVLPEPPGPAALPRLAAAPTPAQPPAGRRPAAPVADLSKRRSGAVGAALAKPGFGLVMRTDGEESLTPFRSLDDLLSAVKPILRATARNADPVWFSIQPVDLATLDSDAA